MVTLKLGPPICLIIIPFFNMALKEGIIIRHMGGPNLRVTIGLPDENRKFVDVLRKVLGK